MSSDTSSGEEAPERGVSDVEHWVVTPRCYTGLAVVAVGAVIAGLGAFLGPGVLPGPGVSLGSAFVSVGAAVVVLGALSALSGCRLTTRQQQYLVRAEREREEIRDYLAFLEDVAAEGGEFPDASDAEGPNADADAPVDTDADADTDPPGGAEVGRPAGPGPGPWWELRSRLRRAERTLGKARQSVYRRDYANFLSLFYEASRQEILLYDLLDSHADGWMFGLPGRERESGEAGEVPGASRQLNLSRRIRSFAEESLPEHRLALVEAYLGEPGDPQTPMELYYAVRVLHEWNVSRFEQAIHVKGFLQGGIAVLAVVLVGLVAVLELGFDGFLAAANATSGPVTSVPDDSILLEDAFLGLVVLAGALGAVFSMLLRSFGQFYALTTDPSIPQPVFMLEALLARALVGSVSAIFLFLVARTEFAGVVFAADLLKSPLALLLVGFVAGISERLVDESVDRIVGTVAPPEGEPPDERTGRDGENTNADADERTDEGRDGPDADGRASGGGGDKESEDGTEEGDAGPSDRPPGPS